MACVRMVCSVAKTPAPENVVGSQPVQGRTVIAAMMKLAKWVG